MLRESGPDAVAPVLLPLLLAFPDLHDAWLAKWREQPRERLADAVSVLMGVDGIEDRLSEITVPALVVHGENDQPVPLSAGRALRDGLPAAGPLLVIPGAGHTPSLTHPGQVTAPMLDFLRANA
jgi:pimeloyl-ACP methyl ester carboxylesterase